MRGMTGCARLRQLAFVLGRLRKRSEAECGACGVGCVGLIMSKGGKRASMVALPQPAANGSLCGCGSIAGSSGWLRKRSEAECGAYEGSFPLNSAYRRCGMKA